MKNNNVLIIIATVIMALMMVVMFYQNRVLDKYKNLLEKIDTTTITKVDTLFLDKIIVDSIPKEKVVKIIQTDTLYKHEGDSIIATPIILKKKVIQTR